MGEEMAILYLTNPRLEVLHRVEEGLNPSLSYCSSASARAR